METIFFLYLKNIHKDSPERAKLARTNVELYALLISYTKLLSYKLLLKEFLLLPFSTELLNVTFL